MNSNNISDFAVINASLTTTNTMGYTVSERQIGFTRDIQVEENKTPFQISIAGGMRIIEYHNGVVVAFVVSNVLTQVGWSGDFLFEGMLRPHFIKGTVRYPVR